VAVDVGQLYRATYEVRDANGALTNATVSLAVTLPDGVTAAPGSPFTPVNDSTGVYHVDFATATVGLHKFAWSSASPTTNKVDWVSVRRFISILSLAVGRDYLGQQDTRADEKIRSLLASTTRQIENRVGPVVVRSFTDRIRTGCYALRLPQRPVVTVTSITSIPTPATVYLTADLEVDTTAGVVRLVSDQPFKDGPWTAVYSAGRLDPSDDIIEAAQRLLWHAWTTQRGITADSVTPDLDDVGNYERAFIGAAHALPWYVSELLAPHKLMRVN
jgi:hypothetical protein